MNKPSGGDEIPSDLFKILKDDTVKVLHSMCQQIWKLSSGHRTGKSVFIPIPKKVNAKECSSYHTIVLISHASKFMLKNPSSQPSAVRKPRTYRCTSWV